MSSEAPRNSYLDQVVAQQQRLEVDLKAKRAPMNQMAAPAPAMRQARGRSDTGEIQLAQIEGAIRAQAAGQPPSNAVEVRVTGFGPWKTVIVPPNAYVVHTRRGHTEPLHLGLGVSFRFNPYVDSYLAVPGAMQTIVINAHSICKELQGLLVQGYVQWIIQDFGTAYKKLDFGDAEDPMRLVNLQLREQAEAAIKDKVATMSIDDVLSDKQPIIEELTARLRHVAEGEGASDKGLGLRIVTVQIKEAVVSSARLWDNLQKPFRAARAKVARLAELESEEVISAREAVTQKARETTQMETERELSALRAKNEAETHDREQAERLRRSQQEQADALALAQAQQATALKKVALEMARVAAEAEATTLKVADVEMDLMARAVTVAGRAVELQPREFSLLEYLMRHPGRHVTKTMILEHVWDYSFDPQTNVVDVLMHRLRTKIDPEKTRIETVRGVGYVIHGNT